jgi:hypothetical protein
VIGSLFAIFGSCVNTLFSLRSPSISLPPIIAELVAYPIGNLWEKYMPNGTFTMFGTQWILNPGPFTVEEHVLIITMARASFYGI